MATTITSPVSAVYGANAAPIATSASSLGVTSQPTTTGGNAAVSTGYASTPVAVTGGGSTTTGATSGVGAGLTAMNNAAGSAVTSAQGSINALGSSTPAATNVSTNAVANNAYASVANQFGTGMANDLATAAGGGVISNALKNGVSSIVAYAQSGMQKIQQAIQGEMAANGGEVDPAKMQLYTMQMSTYELLNQMAAKIQEKQERSVQIWLQN
jgi:hypothetical protein